MPALSASVLRCEASTALWHTLVLVLGLVALTSLQILFRRMTASRRANPLRAAMLPHRACILLLLAVRLLDLDGAGLPEFADLAMLVCVTTALYLGACAEPPPVRRVAGVWAGAEAG
jgi:hypothetical protein